MKLIIAKPSPYARKARIALIEKGIPFEVVVDNPWQPDSRVDQANPLGKVPTLVLDDGSAIHDSKVIVEYLETLDRAPQLLPRTREGWIRHKQIEAVADGICDAIVLAVIEQRRAPEKRSADWVDRQHRKVVAGTAELSHMLGKREWFTDAGMALGDLATVCALEYIDFRYPQFDWRKAAPNLIPLEERLAQRPSFASTKPEPQQVPPLN